MVIVWSLDVSCSNDIRSVECLTWLHYNSLQLSLNLSTDLILLIIPVVLISRLNMKIGK